MRLAFVFLFAAACSNAAEIKKLAAERRADIEAALANYRQLPALLARQAPFAEPQQLAPPPLVNFGGKERNGLVFHAEDLARVDAPGQVPLRIEGRNSQGWTLPGQLAHVVTTGEWKNATVMDDLRSFHWALKDMQAVNYALVIRTAAYTPARSTGERTFEPAHLRGDAVLVALRERKILGGFPFDITGRWRTLTERNGPIRGSKITGDLKDTSELDVESQLGFALGDGARWLLDGRGEPPYATSFFSPEARARH